MSYQNIFPLLFNFMSVKVMLVDDSFQDMLPLLLPTIIINLVILIVALVDLIRNWKVRSNPVLWLIIMLLINLIGPILYLVVGKKQNNND